MTPSVKQPIAVGELTVRFLVEAANSNGTVTVFTCVIPAGSKMPAPHSHDAFEETVYGLSGATTWTVDGQTLEVGVGEALCVPRGAVHGFENRGTDDATYLAMATPGVFGPDYFLADVDERGRVVLIVVFGPYPIGGTYDALRDAEFVQ